MAQQRLPYVDADDGDWGDILNQFLSKEHVDTGLDNAGNGGHKKITVQAGTTSAGTAPIKLTSGALMTSPEVGAIEFFGDKYYMTITNGTTRKRVALLDDGVGATGDVYYRDSNGNFARLAPSSDNKVLTLASGIPSWADTQTPAGVVTETGAATLTNKTMSGSSNTFSNIPLNSVTGSRSFAFFAG